MFHQRNVSHPLVEFPLMCDVLRYPAQLPPLGWSPSPMPGPMAPLGPIGAMEPDWRDIKANLRPRIVSMDGAEASPLFEAPTEGELSLVVS